MRCARTCSCAPAQETLTFRNNLNQTALPIRAFGSFLPGNGVGGAGRALERPDLALPGEGLRRFAAT